MSPGPSGLDTGVGYLVGSETASCSVSPPSASVSESESMPFQGFWLRRAWKEPIGRRFGASKTSMTSGAFTASDTPGTSGISGISKTSLATETSGTSPMTGSRAGYGDLYGIL